jgi:hypothetical protein
VFLRINPFFCSLLDLTGGCFPASHGEWGEQLTYEPQRNPKPEGFRSAGVWRSVYATTGAAILALIWAGGVLRSHTIRNQERRIKT